MTDTPTSFYDFTVKDITGNEVSLERYRGNVVLVVNVASKCGFTLSNYTQLSQLYEKYHERGLRILAFPCNQFGGQEPGDNEEITACVASFAVKFDMFDKVDVNGSKAHPLFTFLKKKQGGLLFDAIKWNFTKFLVDRKGEPVKRYAPNDDPVSFEAAIVALLDEGTTEAEPALPAKV